MPKGNTYGNRLNPSPHTQQYFGALGPSESAIAHFLYPFAWRDVVFHFDDFQQAATLSDWYTLSSDTCACDFAPAAGIGGTISGTTCTGAGDFTAILTGANWQGDNNAGQEMRWQISNVCCNCWEQGFTDPLSDNTLGSLGDIDTPAVANGGADIAIIALQSDACCTCCVMQFVTDGSTACMNTTATAFCGNPCAATYQATRIQIATNAAAGFVFDCANTLLYQAQHGCATASQIEGATDLTARLILGTLACAAKVATVDYWAIWMDRR